MDIRSMSSIVDKVRELMSKELEKDPNLTPGEYERLFVDHYLALIDGLTIPSTNSKGKKYVR
jgi:hypothetical protein